MIFQRKTNNNKNRKNCNTSREKNILYDEDFHGCKQKKSIRQCWLQRNAPTMRLNKHYELYPQYGEVNFYAAASKGERREILEKWDRSNTRLLILLNPISVRQDVPVCIVYWDLCLSYFHIGTDLLSRPSPLLFYVHI